MTEEEQKTWDIIVRCCRSETVNSINCGGKHRRAAILAVHKRLREAREVIESLAYQYAGWDERVGGLSTDALSAMEEAFEFLDWDEPAHPVPDLRCDEPGCMKKATCGWPRGRGPYRRTCLDHYGGPPA